MAQENIALYSPLMEPLNPEWIAELTAGAHCELESDEETGEFISLFVKWPKTKVRIHPRTVYTDPEFGEHIDGFSGYAYQQLAQGEMDAWIYKVLERICASKQSLGIVIEPGFDKDGVCAEFIHHIAEGSRSIIFWQGLIYDARFNLLLGADSSRDDDAALDEAEEALQRKLRSEQLLKAKRIPTLDSLLVLPSADELLPRSAEEIAERAVVLSLLAARAEPKGLELAEVHELIQFCGVADYLSPAERDFLALKNPTESERAQFTWRYEALAALLWSIGLLNELNYPSEICDVPKVAQAAAKIQAREVREQQQLRDLNEILDQADLHYRYHWAAVSARLDGHPAPAKLDEGIVLERRHALNWVLGLRNEEWDDVSTDT